MIRTGDRIYHKPTKETWIVAWVENKDLYWMGYPFGGFANIDDCELLEACDDACNQQIVRQIAETGGAELPVLRCKALLESVAKEQLDEHLVKYGDFYHGQDVLVNVGADQMIEGEVVGMFGRQIKIATGDGVLHVWHSDISHILDEPFIKTVQQPSVG